MRKKLIAGNWKMNGSLAANQALLSGLKTGLAAALNAERADVLVCPPTVYLSQVRAELAGVAIQLGAQDVSVHANGAFTGEVSAQMLQDLGAAYVIIGHSERRAYHAESNELVAQKVLQVLHAGMRPILCVGETLEQRESAATELVVAEQLQAVLDLLQPENLSRLVVAYEPVWAIGTGKTATPEMAQQVHAVLRQQLQKFAGEAAQQVQILYGGSMKPDNAAELLAMPDIDGGLIGGAALKAADFLAIVAAAK